MKRTYRLRRPDQFQRVRREGRNWTHSLVTLNSAPNRRKQSRCGFVVAKRIGNAVVRNRAKRRVREAVRHLLPHIAPGYDLVFVVRRSEIEHIAFVLLQDTIKQLIRQAGLWRDDNTSN